MNPCPAGVFGTPYGACCDCPERPKHYWSGHRHGGVDIEADTGTPVVAAWGGTVTGASWGSAFGTQVVIDQDPLPDGAPGLWAVYAHLSSRAVGPGYRVEPGAPIGAVGATGNVTGPHLHYEVRTAPAYSAGVHTDPRPWLEAGDIVLDAATADQIRALVQEVVLACLRGDGVSGAADAVMMRQRWLEAGLIPATLNAGELASVLRSEGVTGAADATYMRAAWEDVGGIPVAAP